MRDVSFGADKRFLSLVGDHTSRGFWSVYPIIFTKAGRKTCFFRFEAAFLLKFLQFEEVCAILRVENQKRK